MAKRDLTGSYDYDRLIEEEKTHYSDIEVTQDLKEGGVHAGGSWQYYWTRVNEVLALGPVGYIGDYITTRFGERPGVINILSLGSGYCGNEIELARRLGRRARIVCTDINEQLFIQGMAVVAAENLSVEFQVEDLNFISIEPDHYHMIFAHAVLHHVINLESLFEEIAQGLCPDGVLHLVEVVGENRRLIWPENEAFANSLLSLLPDRITQGVRLAVYRKMRVWRVSARKISFPNCRRSFIPSMNTRMGPSCGSCARTTHFPAFLFQRMRRFGVISIS